MRSFRELHPQVQFRIYSANADDVKERIEKGLLDMGLLIEPVEIDRYAFLRLPQKDRWGVLVPRESALAQKGFATPQDLMEIPLLMSGREKVRSNLATWFGEGYDRLNVVLTYNLVLNAANMVRNGLGAALCVYVENVSEALQFVPLSPPLEVGTLLAWKKDKPCSPAVEQFLQHIKNAN